MKLLFVRGPAVGSRLLIFIFLSIILMYGDQHESYFKTIRSGLETAVLPLQYTVDAPIRFLTWVDEGFASHHALVEENRELQAESIILNAKVQKLLALQKENSQLRALLSSASQFNDKVLAAQLLAVNINPSIHEVVLNQGEEKDISVGQPVLDAHGVFGQVISVSPYTSRVLLISDPRSAIPVEINRNDNRGIVVGNGSNSTLNLINIPKTSDVKVGDILLTSGLGGRFPQGYPVGVISKITNEPGSRYAEIDVKPNAQLNRSRQVLLVWDKQVGAA